LITLSKKRAIMEDEQIREFRRVQDEVLQKLRRHAFVEDCAARHVFQYLTFPAFTSPVAWDVFTRRRKGYSQEYLLLRSCWRKDIDAEKFRSPTERLKFPSSFKPTIEIHEVAVPALVLQEITQSLGDLSLPLAAPIAAFGVDGVNFELAIEQPNRTLAAKCRLSWWHKPPEAWQPLTKWLERVVPIFDNAWSFGGKALPVDHAS
jgi:hypothetical protein